MMTDADRPRCLSSPRPKRHLFLFVSEAMLLKRKIMQKSEWGHGGGDGERVCREPNEVQGAPSVALRLHWSRS